MRTFLVDLSPLGKQLAPVSVVAPLHVTSIVAESLQPLADAANCKRPANIEE